MKKLEAVRAFVDALEAFKRTPSDTLADELAEALAEALETPKPAKKTAR